MKHLLTNISTLLLLLYSIIIPHTVYSQSKSTLITPTKNLIISSYTTDNGLPTNSISKTIQSSNGYLWIQTYAGLVRFDGIQTKVYSIKNNPSINSSSGLSVFEDDQQNLWTSFAQSGLSKVENDSLLNELTNEEVGDILHISQGPEHTLYLAGLNGAFIYTPSEKKLEPIEALRGIMVKSLSTDNEKHMWILTENSRIFRIYKNQRQQFSLTFPSEDIKPLCLLPLDPETLLIGTSNGVFKSVSGVLTKEERIPSLSVTFIYIDTFKQTWCITQNGILKINTEGNIETLNTENGLPDNFLIDFYIDQEENIWLSSYRGGVSKLKAGLCSNISKYQKVPQSTISAVCLTPEGTLMYSVDFGGVFELKNNESIKLPIKSDINNFRIKNLMYDKEGTLYISMYGGLLLCKKDGSEQLIHDKSFFSDNQIRYTYQDKASNIWVGTKAGGVFKWSVDGSIKQYTTNEGMKSNYIMSIDEDRDGNIVVGTNSGGISIISINGEVSNYTTEDGLPSNLIFNVYIDKENNYWIPLSGGLALIQNKKVYPIGLDSNIPCDTPFDCVEDLKGNLWLSSNNGVVQISKKELLAYTKNKGAVNWRLFNKLDGMHSDQCTGATQFCMDSMGHVYIPTNGSISIFETQTFEANAKAPIIHLEEFLLDDALLHKSLYDQIAPGNHRYLFSFSGIQFSAPENIKYHYRLLPFGEEWITSGSDRNAIYTNLPAGTYTFEVKACSKEDLCSDPISITFTVKRFWYQTNAFYLSSILVLVLGIYLFVRYRTISIKRKNIELENLVKERTLLLENQKEEISIIASNLKEVNKLVHEKNEDITSAITYASRIQRAMLTNSTQLKEYFSDAFVYYKPRDIVSGDFFFFKKIGSYKYWAAIDCTGHGVPGAFLSVLASSAFSSAVTESNHPLPSEVLRKVHFFFREALNSSDSIRDGMDVSLCRYNEDTEELVFSGAKNSLVFFEKDGDVIQCKGDRNPIGENTDTISFEDHFYKGFQGMRIYLFSDGCTDQFGGLQNKKFGTKRLISRLYDFKNTPFTDVEASIGQMYEDWMQQGREAQIDDMLLVGVEI